MLDIVEALGTFVASEAVKEEVLATLGLPVISVVNFLMISIDNFK